jgi:hypothetical protein
MPQVIQFNRTSKRRLKIMADVAYKTDNRLSASATTDWSAIWAGLFTFAAIWSVFGVLGFAIFPGTGNTVNVGLGWWFIILTVIAMYIAGHQTGRTAAIDGRFQGFRHGIILFGFCVIAGVVAKLAGSAWITGVSATSSAQNAWDLLAVFGGNAWMAFFGLFLGWLAAMMGAAYAAPSRTAQMANVSTMRPAA